MPKRTAGVRSFGYSPATLPHEYVQTTSVDHQYEKRTIPQQLPANSRIMEGVMTTVADVDRFADDPALINIAPMGPIVDATFSRLILRPFKTSTTYRNLKATGQGVFHITDDALLIARGAIGKLNADHQNPSPPAGQTQSPFEAPSQSIPVYPAQKIKGVILADACRIFEFQVTTLDDAHDRTHIEATVVHREERRPFIGFNRAKHAVLEAAILATRIHLTGVEPVLDDYEKLQVIVDKTGDADEHTAMHELRTYVESKL